MYFYWSHGNVFKLYSILELSWDVRDVIEAKNKLLKHSIYDNDNCTLYCTVLCTATAQYFCKSFIILFFRYVYTIQGEFLLLIFNESQYFDLQTTCYFFSFHLQLSISKTRCSSSVCCQYTGRGHSILPTYFVPQKPSFFFEQWLIEKETEWWWLKAAKRGVFRLRVLYTIKAYICLQNWKRKLMILKISPRSSYYPRENPIQHIQNACAEHF